MTPIKATTVSDLLASARRDKEIYDALSEEERAEVDAFNAAIRGKNIKEIIAMGDHPMKRFRARYTK